MDNSSSLVTVVMTAYNSVSCVSKAITSVIAQTYQDWKLIVVDDHSTDSTLSILRDFANRDNRIEIIAQAENHRPARSRNAAIAASSSPLIAILDADDAWFPDKLRLQVEFMSLHPEVDVLGTASYWVLPDEPDAKFLMCPPATHEELAQRIYLNCPITHSTVLYRRQFIERAGGYRTDFLRCEDGELWMRTYRDFRFHNLQEPLVEYTCSKIPPFSDLPYVTKMYYQAAVRERSLLKHSWHIVRPIIAYTAIRMGLRPGYLRKTKVAGDTLDGQLSDNS